MNLSEAELERVAALIDEIEAATDAGEELDPAALAERFALGSDVVEQCLTVAQVVDVSLREEESRSVAWPDLPDDYEVRSELGRGGMGVVYRVHQRSLDREVALKVLRPGDLMLGGAIERFQREARSLARLRHRHIVSVHEVGEANGLIYFTMDLVAGRTLADLVESSDLTITQAVKLLRQVAAAIGYAHSQGIVHRDLKPANILVDENGDAFVVDFGLARDLNVGGGETLTGVLLGTPAYMSPEQIRGDTAAIGDATDVYALGIVLYEALAGRGPFAGKPLAELIPAVLEETPPALRKLNARVPRDLEVICMKAMARRPMDRYPTASAFSDDLERFAAGQPILARSPSRLGRIVRSLWRVRRLVAGVLVTTAIILIAAWHWLLPGLLVRGSLASARELCESRDYRGALTLLRRLVNIPRESGNAGSIEEIAAAEPEAWIAYLATLNEYAGRLLLEDGDVESARRVMKEAEGLYPTDSMSLGSEDLAFQATRGEALRSALVMQQGASFHDRGRLRMKRALERRDVLDVDLITFAITLRSQPRLAWTSSRRPRQLMSRLLRRLSRLPQPSVNALLDPLMSGIPIGGRQAHPKSATKWLCNARDEELEGVLSRLLLDEGLDLPTRQKLFLILCSISDRYPCRVHRRNAEGRSRYFVSMGEAEFKHIYGVRRHTKGLPRAEAYKKRLEMYASLLPKTAVDRAACRAANGVTGEQDYEVPAEFPLPEREPDPAARYRLEHWFLNHVGVRITTREEWRAWWGRPARMVDSSSSLGRGSGQQVRDRTPRRLLQ